MAKVIIIGAGLTGLSTAYHLEQHNFFDYVLVEKEQEIGGLCRSIRTSGFTFDYTGHFFYSSNPEVLAFMRTPMANSAWRKHTRAAFIYSNGVYTPYPYQTHLYGLPAQTIVECITGFINRPSKGKAKNFASWVLTHFGTGFAQHFFYPYQEKIFDYPLHKLRTGWTGVVPSTSLQDILYGALTPRSIGTIGYNAHFLYPETGGIDCIAKTIGSNLKNPILTNSAITAINARTKTVQFSTGRQEAYEYLVSTMPLKQLLPLITDPSRSTYAQLSDKLLCNSLLNINIGVNHTIEANKHWVYYPEKRYPFFRIGFPHALHSAMTPSGCSSLSIEITKLSPFTPEQVNRLANKTYRILNNLFNITKSNIITEHRLIIDHAYVVYNTWHEKHRLSLLDDLKKYGIYSTGRYGAWKYAGMSDAMSDGIKTATFIMQKEHR